MAYESRNDSSDPLIFCGLLDEHFDAGRPRRHAPGSGAGEEEILLQPSDEVLGFLLGPAPEMVRAVRPKLDNFRPVRERTPKEIVGHRLEIRQILDEDRSGVIATTYFIHTFAELQADTPAKLRMRKEGSGDVQWVRHRLDIGGTGLKETMYEDLGPLWSSRHNKDLTADEITELFQFIGGCVWREPREFE